MEGYLQVQSDVSTVHCEVCNLIFENGLGLNPKGRMCIMYIIAKAKSLLKGLILLATNLSVPGTPHSKKALETCSMSNDMVFVVYY